ncbi:hypothetical protein MXB_929 [Myxobolus squamalis]|nr:hypothetical protein MXB_929 [Myxobolus squamalis]
MFHEACVSTSYQYFEMTSTILTLFFLFFASLYYALPSDEGGNKKWGEYKSNLGISFKNEEEDQRRMKIFQKNEEFIKSSNAKNSGLTLKMNEFGHLEKHEIPRGLGLAKNIDRKDLLRGSSPEFE